MKRCTVCEGHLLQTDNSILKIQGKKGYIPIQTVFHCCTCEMYFVQTNEGGLKVIKDKEVINNGYDKWFTEDSISKRALFFSLVRHGMRREEAACRVRNELNSYELPPLKYETSQIERCDLLLYDGKVSEAGDFFINQSKKDIRGGFVWLKSKILREVIFAYDCPLFFQEETELKKAIVQFGNVVII